MKILFLNHNIEGRSTYHRCMGFARELVRLGHQVTLITTSKTSKIKIVEKIDYGINIICTPSLLIGRLRQGWDLFEIFSRIIYLNNRKFDLVHAFDTRPTVIIPALVYKKKHPHVPLVIDWADWWGKGGAISLRKQKLLNSFFSPVETWFEEYFRDMADYTTVTSALLKKRANKLGIANSNISVLHSGADIKFLKFMNKSQARKKLNIQFKSFVCIFPAYVLYDIQIVLQSFLRFQQKVNNAILFLIGEFPKKLINDYSRYFNRGIIRIFIDIPYDKLGLYLSAADVGLLPMQNNLANRARFPIKFGDYLATNLPVVTTNVGDIGYLVKKHKLGLICKYSAKELSKGLLSIKQNPVEVKNIKSSIKQFVKLEFSWERKTQELLKIYNSFS